MLIKPDSNISNWPIARISRNRDEIMEQVIAESMEVLLAKTRKSGILREELARAHYLEKIRMKEEPWKVDPKDERQFWNNIKEELIRTDPNTTEKEVAKASEEKMLREIISRYVHEIMGNFSPKMYEMARTILPLVFGRLLHAITGRIKGLIRPDDSVAERLFQTGPIDKIRKLSEIGTLILVPTHHSNLDSTILGYGMDRIGLPAFQYGAGLNLFNSKFFGFFMGRLGAYKLDRRKKTPIYIETLKAFSRVMIQNGSHTLFFPGGTRSRSGGLESRLKLGLLGTVIESQRKHFESVEDSKDAKKIFILPLTMSYHFVLEAPTLINEHLKRTGKEMYITIDDEFSSLFKIGKFFRSIFAKSSEITLSMGEPMDIFGHELDEEGNSLDAQGNPIDISQYFVTKGELKADEQREAEYTSMLGKHILTAFRKANTVYSSHVVAFVAFEILKSSFKKADIFTVLRLPEEEREIGYTEFSDAVRYVIEQLYVLNNLGQLKLPPHMSLDVEDIIEHGIKNIGIYHSKEPLKKTKEGSITSEDMKLLYFYHNRMDGYGLEIKRKPK